MHLMSIQVGRVQTATYRQRPITTGIFKAEVRGPVMVRSLNVDGDEQADLRVHGGRDKAVYAYSDDAYPSWRQLRPKDTFVGGSMGENLTFEALDEEQIFIGDIYQLGDAQLQVTQPRQPCFKLGVKYNDPKIIVEFNRLGRPGVYFRVLREGLIEPGQALTLVSREQIKVAVSELFRFTIEPATDLDRIREILAIESLPDYWREGLSNLLG